MHFKLETYAKKAVTRYVSGSLLFLIMKSILPGRAPDSPNQHKNKRKGCETKWVAEDDQDQKSGKKLPKTKIPWEKTSTFCRCSQTGET